MARSLPSPAIPCPATPPLWRRLLPGAVIVLAAIVVYWDSLAGPFVFDDIPAIVDNPSIRHLARLGAVLNPPNDGSSVTGRPLVNLTLALNHAWGGTNPWGYHVGNLVLHALAGLALFGLVRRTLRKPVFTGRYDGAATVLAAASALLWVVHPLQTDAVTFVIQRTEVLMGLCYLATLYLFARATDTTPASRRGLLAAAACCALGMAAKEVMVTAPLMVLLYDRTFVAGTFREALRQRRLFYLGLAATWLPLLWLIARGGGTRGAGAGLGLGVTWWSYALKQCEAIVLYLRLSCWPHPLVLDHGAGVVTEIREVAPQALALLLLVAGSLVALRRRPTLGFLGAWFFVILAPSSSVVPLIGQTVAEHRMYLPLAAVVVTGVLGLFRLLGKSSLGWFVALAVGWGGLTVLRNRDYHDALTLWRDTVLKAPGNYRAHYNLAVELARAPGGKAEAIAEYEKAVQLQPDYADAHDNLGVELAQCPGREDEALVQYATALRLRPDFADAHYNLAVELGKRPGGATGAIAHYEAALRLRPDFPEAHNNLAVELAKISGRLPEAIGHYEAALRLLPDYPEAHFGLANALAASPARLPEAIAHYEAAVRLQPDFLEARNNLAYAYYRSGRLDEAIRQLTAVLQLDPENQKTRRNLELLKNLRRP